MMSADSPTPMVPSTEDGDAGDLAPGTPLRVLVVDDEPSMCRAMSLSLAWYGLEAVAVDSADAALAALEAQQFDVLLVDLRLRGTRGDALYEAAIARQPALRERTLFMTGDISAEAERAIAATNCPYLRKPFDITLAIQAIYARAARSIAPRSPPVRDGRSDELQH